MPRNTILVIEALGENISKVSAAIRPFATRLMWADNLHEGKRLISEGRPEIILIADDTPGFDGNPTELLELMDSLKLPAQLLVMTKDPDFEKAMELVASGVFSVLALPISTEKLRNTVKRVLENLSLLNSLVDHSRIDSEKELKIYKKLARSHELPVLVESIKETVEELYEDSFCKVELSEELSPYLDCQIIDEEEVSLEMFNFDEENIPIPESFDIIRPLEFKNLSLGKIMINLPYKSQRLKSQNHEALDELVWAASLHLFQAKQYHEAVKLASKDPLTALFNRRVFMENLDKEFSRAKRHNTPLSLIILDIDHFKNVNDTYGHQTGDTILKWLAGVISATIRTGDIVGRIGGEEFAILLPWTDQEQAKNLAARLKASLASSPQPTSQKLLRPTISQGISSLAHFLINSPEDLIYWADQAMYLAKKQGRDTIRIASDLQPKTQFEDTHYVFQ